MGRKKELDASADEAAQESAVEAESENVECEADRLARLNAENAANKAGE